MSPTGGCQLRSAISVCGVSLTRYSTALWRCAPLDTESAWCLHPRYPRAPIHDHAASCGLSTRTRSSLCLCALRSAPHTKAGQLCSVACLLCAVPTIPCTNRWKVKQGKQKRTCSAQVQYVTQERSTICSSKLRATLFFSLCRT